MRTSGDEDTPMNDQPIKAAELVRKARGGLSRYRTIPDTLTELSGRLEDVQTTGDDDAWIVVRPVDGLDDHDMATATIRSRHRRSTSCSSESAGTARSDSSASPIRARTGSPACG